MKQLLVKRDRGERNLTKRVEFSKPERVVGNHIYPASHGFTSEPAGREEFFFSVTLDTDELVHLSQRAAANKGGVARDGALTVKIIERKRI
jgi:hypothetical protein